jgi:hypothetical protein
MSKKRKSVNEVDKRKSQKQKIESQSDEKVNALEKFYLENDIENCVSIRNMLSHSSNKVYKFGTHDTHNVLIEFIDVLSPDRSVKIYFDSSYLSKFNAILTLKGGTCVVDTRMNVKFHIKYDISMYAIDYFLFVIDVVYEKTRDITELFQTNNISCEDAPYLIKFSEMILVSVEVEQRIVRYFSKMILETKYFSSYMIDIVNSDISDRHCHTTAMFRHIFMRFLSDTTYIETCALVQPYVEIKKTSKFGLIFIAIAQDILIKLRLCDMKTLQSLSIYQTVGMFHTHISDLRCGKKSIRPLCDLYTVKCDEVYNIPNKYINCLSESVTNNIEKYCVVTQVYLPPPS